MPIDITGMFQPSGGAGAFNLVALVDVEPAGTWKILYANGSSPPEIGELTLGASGTVLRSAGPSAIPTFAVLAHGDLGSVTSDQHHAQAHSLASHSTKAHNELSDSPADAHHAQAHEHLLARVASSTYSSVQHLQDIFHSVGFTSGGVISDAGSETIDVAAGTGLIRATDSSVAELLWFDWSLLSGASIPTGTIRYIGIEYNAGSPQAVVRTSYNWNFTTDFPLGNVVNDAGTLHIENAPHTVGDHASFMIQRLYDTAPFHRSDKDGGLILGETGTRNVTTTLGYLWERLSKFTIAVIDTSGADRFDRYYRDGVGGWTEEAAQSQWNNTQYDDGSGTLVTMTNNRYSVQYFYVELDGNLVSVYGQAQYVSEAQAEADVPPVPPPRIMTQATLIGRIIFQKSEATAEAVESVYTTTFSSSGVIDHDNLAGINADNHHVEVHAPESHSDTDITGAELEDLSDGGATTLHTHAAHGKVSKSIMFHSLNEDLAVEDWLSDQAIRVPASGKHGTWTPGTIYVRVGTAGTGTNTILFRTSTTLTGVRTTRAVVSLGTAREASTAITWTPADGEYLWVYVSAIGGTAPKNGVAQIDLEEAIY